MSSPIWTGVVSEVRDSGSFLEVVCKLSNDQGKGQLATTQIAKADTGAVATLNGRMRQVTKDDVTAQVTKGLIVQGLALDLTDPVVTPSTVDPIAAQFQLDLSNLRRTTRALADGVTLATLDRTALQAAVQSTLSKHPEFEALT